MTTAGVRARSLTAVLLRHGRLVRTYLWLAVRQDVQWRTDMLFSLLHLFANLGASLLFWFSILPRSGPLADWGAREFCLYAAIGTLSGAFDVFTVPLRALPEMVIRGQVDRFLARPVNVLFAIMGEGLRLRYPVNEILSGSTALIVTFLVFDFRPPAGGVACAIVLMICGVWAMTLIRTTLSLLSFWLGRVSFLQDLLGAVSGFARYPVTFYDTALRRFLTWFLPMGLYLTLPVLALTGELRAPAAALAGAVATLGVWGLIVLGLWSRALGRYESGGG